MKKIINPFVNIEGYCCPGCCPTNERGLRLEFFEDGDDIVSYWTPDPNLQSWRNTLFHKLQTVAVTSRMDTRYLKPITIDGGVVEMRARLTKQVRQVSYIDAELIQGGEVCSKAQVIYFCHSRERSLAEYNFGGCETE